MEKKKKHRCKPNSEKRGRMFCGHEFCDFCLESILELKEDIKLVNYQCPICKLVNKIKEVILFPKSIDSKPKYVDLRKVHKGMDGVSKIMENEGNIFGSSPLPIRYDSEEKERIYTMEPRLYKAILGANHQRLYFSKLNREFLAALLNFLEKSEYKDVRFGLGESSLDEESTEGLLKLISKRNLITSLRLDSTCPKMKDAEFQSYSIEKHSISLSLSELNRPFEDFLFQISILRRIKELSLDSIPVACLPKINNQDLEKLTCRECQLSDDTVNLVLGFGPNLKSLNLSNNFLTGKGVEEIANYLNEKTTDTLSLNFSSNKIDEEGLNSLLPLLHRISKLDLRNNLIKSLSVIPEEDLKKSILVHIEEEFKEEKSIHD